MNFLRRDAVCSMLRLSPQQGYRIIGATDYGARISSSFVIELLNRSRVGKMPAIVGDGAWNIPSDLVTADEIVSTNEMNGVTEHEILLWSRRKRNPIPHYRINRKTRLYRKGDVIEWMNSRSPRTIL